MVIMICLWYEIILKFYVMNDDINKLFDVNYFFFIDYFLILCKIFYVDVDVVIYCYNVKLRLNDV